MTSETPEELINDISRMIDELPSRAEYNRLKTALETIAHECGNYGDGAPDAHPLAHTMLNLESIARAALREPSADTIIAETG